MSLVLYAVIAVCLAVIVVLYWSHHADLHHPENGLEVRVAWLIDQNGRLRTALRGAGIPVDDDEEPAGSGRHAAKSVERATIPLNRPQSPAERPDHLDTRTTGATPLPQAIQTDDEGKGAA